MNKANTRTDSVRNDSGGYRTWKQKEQAPEKKDLNTASFTEFPDLVKDTKKKTVFEGTSLANKLKETIAAEEEAAIQRRLKKGETPEMILREMCSVLPLKGAKRTSGPIEIPWWVTDESMPVIFPSFKHKSLAQLAQERRWKRLGVNPRDVYLYDREVVEDDDVVSLPSEPASEEEDFAELNVQEEEILQQ